MSEQKLDCTQVETAGEPPARSFVTQVVPVQIDLRELLTVDPSARLASRRLDTVSEQHKRLPSGPDRALVLTRRSAEGVPVGAKESAPL